MKSVTVNHHRRPLGCLDIFILIIPIFLLYLLGVSIFSVKGVIQVLLVFLLIRYGVPALWSKIPRARLPKPIQALIPQRAENREIFSINKTVTIANPYAGVFISGGAGSGKSKSLIEPLIKESGKKEFTGVVYDFKFPELAQYIETAYRDSEIRRFYFSFDHLGVSQRINPISPALMTRESFAREFAYTILANLNPQMIKKPDFWTDNATTLLTAVFWYLREMYPRFCTLPHAISMIMQPNFEALLRELCTVTKCADMIAPIMTAYEQGADNQLAGVLSSLQISLSKINFDEVYYLMSESDIDLTVNDPDKRAIITIGNNPQLSSTYAPLIGLILTSISKQLNRQDKEKSVFMIDEFPTVYIPNVEQLPATARSNKVATILACQDISQIVDKYGKEKAETILSNLGNQFYGRTPNPQTAQRVSELFGKEEQQVISTSQAGSWAEENVTSSTRETQRVRSQDVANLDTGSFYTILSEGRLRQGLSSIPMDKQFQKSTLPVLHHVDEKTIKQAYHRVTLDVSEVILRNSILQLQAEKG